MHAADAEIGRMHPRAGGALVKHHQLFALFKTPQRRGQRADVHRLRGDVEQMRQDAADLAIEHPDQLPAARHLDAEQLFRRETERVLLIHRRDIVEPVEIRDRLQIGLVLDQFFGAAMKQADMRIDAGDDLAVELQHQAQHAVRGRMLRAKIDRKIAQCCCFVHDQTFGPRLLIARQHRIVRAFPWREKIEFAEFLIEADGLVQHPLLLVVVAHLDEAGEREILAQRMAVEAVIGQQPPHVRMAGEDHAIEIVGLALEPVGARKHLDDRRHLGGLVGRHAQADARVQRRRQQMIDHVEALLAAGIVHRGHIGQVDEAASRIVAQEAARHRRSCRPAPPP